MCAICEKHAEDSALQLKLEQEEKEHKKLINRWAKICPAGYQKARIDQMPAELISLYEKWDPFAPKSIYMKGKSGIGKTSAAFLFARAAHFAGKKVGYWQASDLRHKAIKAASGEQKFARFKEDFLEADLIILDDFGNTAKTAASDEHLLSLLEGARSNEIAIITTTQHHGKDLVESFHNPSIGMAISNRVQDAIRVDLFQTTKPASK